MHTVTAIFDSTPQANRAVEELEAAGIARDKIGMVTTQDTHDKSFRMDLGNKAAQGGAAGAVIGGSLGALAAALTAVGAIVAPGIGLLATGPIAAALAGAGAGGAVGGFLGGLIGLGIPEYEAKFYETQLKEGGILIAVETQDRDESKKVKQIFEACHAQKIAA